MLRLPVSISSKTVHRRVVVRSKSSSSFIRQSFIEFFVNEHGHKHVRSSPVVPLCDPTVPFVNAGMNQFKGVFLGTVTPPAPRVVNSQKCVRVGGKHNDLEAVGLDGHHHTFFEMLGNWSFDDYYKKEACKMAWDLLLGPYRLKPEHLVVTYFGGDAIIGLPEDRECRDAWLDIGVSSDRLKAMGSADNFWEMGDTGPCGPCTEIHHINEDGSLTEIWNLVFIHHNRSSDGKVSALRSYHVDTGLGLERLAARLQGATDNYRTDLFSPLLAAIEKNSKGCEAYGGRYGDREVLDTAYRRLADHARMISVCLADGVFPGTSLNLKQVMRKSFKISTDVFQNPDLVNILYDEVMSTLGQAYPELVRQQVQAKTVIKHEAEAYRKLRSDMKKKWKDLAKQHPEVVELSDVELAGFVQGYRELKEVTKAHGTNTIPGEVVFKLYDTHGFTEQLIERVAALNHLEIDKKGFWKLLSQHKARHKTAMKEQTADRANKFEDCIKTLESEGITATNDQAKYEYDVVKDQVAFEPLKTELVAILNEDVEWVDYLEPSEDRPYYLVVKDTNFYCEEGGQAADTGRIILDSVVFNVETVFKIRDIVFHKGYFQLDGDNTNYLNNKASAVLEIDGDRRLRVMGNHTGVHLLNAALRKVMKNSSICQTGSSVTDKGLSLSLAVYGEKLTPKVIQDVEQLIRKSISADVAVHTRVASALTASQARALVTLPGEIYPEQGLRIVTTDGPIISRELCCGTHVPRTGAVREFCVTRVRGAGGNAPTVHALTGDLASQARELFCRASKLQQVVDLVDPSRKAEEIAAIRQGLAGLCAGSGAPAGDHKECLALLEDLQKRVSKNDMAVQAVAEEEIRSIAAEARESNRPFIVHFLRCSYLMQQAGLERALAETPAEMPSMLIGCAGGVILAAARVPEELVSGSFCASSWLSCAGAAFQASLAPGQNSPHTFAQMVATKVSLITCEQQVQDAMRAAIKYAQAHAASAAPSQPAHGHGRSTN